jgi:hypothetical protein
MVIIFSHHKVFAREYLKCFHNDRKRMSRTDDAEIRSDDLRSFYIYFLTHRTPCLFALFFSYTILYIIFTVFYDD